MHKNQIKKRLGMVLATATLLGLAGSVWAQQTASSSGEVRRIDGAKGSIAIKQGEISDMQLPAMTLVYQVDPSLIQGIKPGDSVSFTLERSNNKYKIIKIKR